MAYQFNWYEEGFIVSFQGQLEVQEIKDAKHIWKKLPQTDTINYQIWDFSEATLQGVYESDTEDHHVFEQYRQMKIALVVNDDHAMHLAKVYMQRAFERGSAWEIEIFKTVKAAQRWINGQSNHNDFFSHKISVPNVFEHIDLAFIST